VTPTAGSVAPRARRTVAGRASVAGTGLHLGQACTVTFAPAASGTGVRFVRTDRPGATPVPAHVSVAVQTERRTQLGTGDDAFHTVEHVLAAVAGLGVDDLVIECTGPEPPIDDGSAQAFVDALQRAGIVEHDGTVTPLVVRKPMRITDGESVYDAMPAPGLALEVAIEFPHPAIGAQRTVCTVTPESFVRDLASARTFGFVHEVDALRAKGLIKGGTLASAVVLDDAGLVQGTLRWPDEFVRHKALDCVGDLALAGHPVVGRIVAHKPSHRGTMRLVEALVANANHSEGPVQLGIEDIIKLLPHRYPFLLVDRVLELEAGKRVVGIKNVTINEPFFQGHFPGHPIMPGVLIVEAMAQVGGLLLLGTVEDPESKVVYFMSLDNVKFRKPVKPGDQLRFEVEVLQIRGRVCRIRGIAKVEGEVVCEGDMAAMVRDR
jgi:UDP-3-O-[3-hydroxymyristoyl] N-acetylglucosamine deacetylase / 3-hydroxyacyl-[acyl-carrier-protein] dehydratase